MAARDRPRLMRVGILCHPGGLPLWQVRAVERIAAGNHIYLLQCQPPPRAKLRRRHAAYYALNLASIRNRMTRRSPFPNARVKVQGKFEFRPTFDGAWAVLPDELIEWAKTQRLDVIVKFGLGLLRVPDTERLPVPILSYHHGDPSSYRGRPAGFYEIVHGERFVGQVVQVIGNELDRGSVLAFTQSRVVPHSYRKTLIEAYRLSPYLLPEALEALAAGRRVPLEPHGPAYRLPSNGTVARFALDRLRRLFGRIDYGALIEKRWSVSWVAVDGAADPPAIVREGERRRSAWAIPERLGGYSFYADPFFHSGPADIVVEAMKGRSGKGELVRIEGQRQRRIAGFEGHVSYPGAVEEQGRLYLVPEISDWSGPALYELDGERARRVADLDCDARKLIDPTLARVGKTYYLFANTIEDGPSVLHLWSSPSLFARFERHPCSPIRVSARGSRMAGELMRLDDGLYRLGQDFRDGYGDGILAFRIEAIDDRTYREEPAGEAAFESVRGPHTVNLRDGTLLFDWYVEGRSPTAGLRRLLNRCYRIISG